MGIETLATTTFRAGPVFWLAFLLIGLIGLWWALRLNLEILAAGRMWQRWPGLRRMHRTYARLTERRWGPVAAKAYGVVVSLAVICGSLVGLAKSV